MNATGVGGDKIDAVSFRLVDDFEVKIGKDQEIIKIPRLSFVNGEMVVQTIAKALSKDTATALQVIGMDYERKEKGVDHKAYDKIAKSIESLVDQIVQYKLYGMVKELLFVTSEKAITKEIIEKLQFVEAVALLSYLLDENLASLKNLFASLEVITSSEK